MTTVLTKQQQINGLKFAGELAAMAQKAPNISSKRELYRVVNLIRRKYGFSAEQKRDEIFRLIENGATTLGELEAESGYETEEIKTIIAELLSKNRIFSANHSATGLGRPTPCYFVDEQNL